MSHKFCSLMNHSKPLSNYDENDNYYELSATIGTIFNS